MNRKLAVAVLALILISLSSLSLAAISPQEVVVVCNNYPSVASASRAVAKYYCNERGIPLANILEVTVSPNETISPQEFLTDILSDKQNQDGLKTFLSSRPGFDLDSPGSDPTKALVLCYGIPLKMAGYERNASLDGALALLFSSDRPDSPTEANPNGWGQQPIGSDNAFIVSNPYYEETADPANREKPAEFSEFRWSSDNQTVVTAPGYYEFTIVRMLDDSHALAGGYRGILYRGEKTSGVWYWTAIPDEKKGFICHNVSDIFVLDSQHAWVCTDYGSLLQTGNAGQDWTLLRQGSAWGGFAIKSISFFSAQEGWLVAGSALWECNNGSLIQRGSLPTGLAACSIAATDDQHVWVSGTGSSGVGGIWFTADGGTNWTQQYTPSSGNGTGDIWVSGSTGWAVTSGETNCHILRWDGTSWSVDSTVPTIYSGSAKMAVYDATHLAIAPSGTFYLYNNGTWTTDSSDSSGKISVAWAGGDSIVAACTSGSELRARQGSQGSYVWASHRTPSMTWRLRYAVSHLEGYARTDVSSDWTTVVIDGQNCTIPADVKELVDRATRANAAGRDALTNAKVVLDDPYWSGSQDSYHWSTDFRSLMGSLVGTSDVVYDSTHTYITGSYVLPDQTCLDQHDTIAYCSSGSYHPNAHNCTLWWRPSLAGHWKDGAIAFFQDVSTDGRTFRAPSFLGGLQNDANIQSGYLKVTVPGLTSLYNTHWLGLYSGTTLLLRSNFVNGAATIDLTGIARGNYYVEIHFPDDDPLHSQPGTGGECITRQPITYSQQDSGLAYTCSYGQCLDVELIRDGASATTGNVFEPYRPCCPQSEVILPQYATGRTWAESAYMGLPVLAWQEAVVGDPLMAPFAVQPTVAFATPTPANADHVRGPVSLRATATPTGNGTIQRIDFWLNNGQSSSRIGTDYDAPYECVWDSEALSGGNRVYADGNYTIEAIAYQSGNVVGASSVSRSVVLDSTGVPSVSISQPQADNSVVSVSTPVVAQPTGTPSSIEFWLFGNGNTILAGTATTSPYQCSISSAIASNGVYQLQAIAYYGTPASTSYSSRRQIVLVNNFPAYTSIGAMGFETDGTELFLASTPVVAGTSTPMEGAFYVEDASRAAGIRVETTQSVQIGRLVTIHGILHKGTTPKERYVSATQIWDMGITETPSALGMTNKSLGGAAPTGTPGIDGGVGLYNVGLLTKTTGRVTYAGSDFIYVDDGSGLYDSNDLQNPMIAPVDGSAIIDPGVGVKGVRVYFADLAKPGIDDYVAVTGISSIEQIGTDPVRRVRLLRARSVSDAAYFDQFTRARAALDYMVSIPDLTPLSAGTNVRLVDHRVQWKGTINGYTSIWLQDASQQYPITVAVPGQPQVNVDDIVTVTGVILPDRSPSPTNFLQVDASEGHVYLGGSTYGAMSVPPSTSSTMASVSSPISSSYDGRSGGGPFRPWPGPTIEEILASESFRLQYGQVGAIGWALSQPDGSVIDLPAEAICGEWYDGRVLGLREWFEPIPNGPRLFLYLDQPIRLDARLRDMATIDIIGGKLVTLSDGVRALVKPEAVYAYTDSTGQWMFPLPWPKFIGRDAITDASDNWPWKTKVAP